MEAKLSKDPMMGFAVFLMSVIIFTGPSDAWGVQLRDPSQQQEEQLRNLGWQEDTRLSETTAVVADHQQEAGQALDNRDDEDPMSARIQLGTPSTSSSVPGDETTSAEDDSSHPDPHSLLVIPPRHQGSSPNTPPRSISQLLSKLEADYQAFASDVAELQQQGVRSLAAVGAKVASRDVPGIESSRQKSVEDHSFPLGSSSEASNDVTQPRRPVTYKDPLYQALYHSTLSSNKDAEGSSSKARMMEGSSSRISRPNPYAYAKEESAVKKAITSRTTGSRGRGARDPSGSEGIGDIRKQLRGSGKADSSNDASILLENKRNLATPKLPASKLAEYETMIKLLIKIASEREVNNDGNEMIPHSQDPQVITPKGQYPSMMANRTSPITQPSRTVASGEHNEDKLSSNRGLEPKVSKKNFKRPFQDNDAKDEDKAVSEDPAISINSLDGSFEELPRFAYHTVSPPAGILFPSRTAVKHHIKAGKDEDPVATDLEAVTTGRPKPIMAISIASPATFSHSKQLHFLHVQPHPSINHHGRHHIIDDKGISKSDQPNADGSFVDRSHRQNKSSSAVPMNQLDKEPSFRSEKSAGHPSQASSLLQHHTEGVATNGPSRLIDRLDQLLQKLHSGQQTIQLGYGPAEQEKDTAKLPQTSTSSKGYAASP